ncbi:30S ribosomal protein S12 methylthiotransferase RimO [bacterium]|nr:30S ribosomal protein S12 methylthiotransferase RimO [bacterium]
MKVNLTTLGCPKNIVDSEVLLGGLKGNGVEIVEDSCLADTIILNTCGFIQGAKEESIDAILQAVELKKSGNCKHLFVTGCLSQRYRDELAYEIPEGDGFYGNRDITKILRDLLGRLDLRRELLGERELTTPRHYAYLKISEGCENPCTFCSIPEIRGPFRSRPLNQLINEAEMLVDRGVRELILIAQDSTIYGQDLYGEKQLVPLLDKLTGIADLKWVRLLYTFPAHFSDDLIEIITERSSLINYVDMPIQHISDHMLRRMARKVTRRDIEKIIKKLRGQKDDVALRTTLIVGFPGETEDDCEELSEFIEAVEFDRLGVFAYSQEENTPAYDFVDQVPEYIKQERLATLTDRQAEISRQQNAKLMATRQTVIIDDYDETHGSYVGRTYRDCPEIDNSVYVNGSASVGVFRDVEIMGFSDFELYGKF